MKSIDTKKVIGDLFSPSKNFVVPNSGSVVVSGWIDRRAIADGMICVSVGKRSIVHQLTDCAREAGDYWLFRFQVKIGKGFKKLGFSVVSSDGKRHPFATRLIWQKDRISELPVEELPAEPEKTSYDTWLEEHEPKLRSVNFLSSKDELPFPVSVSWVVELIKGDPLLLGETLISVLSSIGSTGHIILCVPDDETVFDDLSLKDYASHPLLSFCCVSEVNTRLAQFGDDWLSFLREGDLIDSNLCSDLSSYLSDHSDCKLFYTDYDSVDEDWTVTPVILPDWNRDLHTSTPYLSNSFFAKVDLFLEVGGFGGESYHRNWALLLKITRRCSRHEIGRLCGVYFHLGYRESSQCEDADTEARQILENHLQEKKISGEVLKIEANHTWRLKYDIALNGGDFPKVSLLIPTRDGVEVLATCVNSILEKTTYPNYEILILDNDSEKSETLSYFEEIKAKGCRIISCPGKFNYSQINNRGSMEAEGEILGFLNNDLEVVDGGWLHEMVSQALRPDIGAVGAKLLYPDKTLQHTGVLLGVGHVAAHAHRLFENDIEKGPVRAHAIQNYSAVTAACLLVKKAVFHEVGGFDDVNLAITNNDVDLCIKIREAGYRNLYTPFATLFHHESATRGPEDTPEKLERYKKEVAYMWERWSDILLNDPAYNRLLTRFSENFALAEASEIDRYKPNELF